MIQYGTGPSIGSIWQRFGRCQRDLSKQGRCVWLLTNWAGPQRKTKVTPAQNRKDFEDTVAGAPVLTSNLSHGDDAGKKWRRFTKDLVTIIKRERFCYRQLFMMYFKSSAFTQASSNDSADERPSAINENCCDACYNRKRQASLEEKNKELHMPQLEQINRILEFNKRKNKRRKGYAAGLIDEEALLNRLTSTRKSVYEEYNQPVIIGEEAFLPNEAMLDMIKLFARAGPHDDALAFWLAGNLWAYKNRYGDRFFETMKVVVEERQLQLSLPQVENENSANATVEVNEDVAKKDQGEEHDDEDGIEEVPEFEI